MSIKENKNKIEWFKNNYKELEEAYFDKLHREKYKDYFK